MKLPTPSHTAHLHSDQLTQIIRQEIKQSNGLISFARFMELALYSPGLGYYSAGQLKFGRQGDFVTAPEITDLFAQCIAAQCRQILTELKSGDILEIGAGSGVFAKDLLITLEKLNSLPEHYFILEISAELRERQHDLLSQNLPHLLSRIIWLNELPVILFNGIIIANEVMDAMPVHRFTLDRIKNKTSMKEQYVTWQKDHFTWQPAPPTSELEERLTFISEDHSRSPGYTSEINLLLPHWIQSVAHCLNKGIILLFDYGYGRSDYYHPDRNAGTLMCYYQHHRHDDPFQFIGLQDITAHVDFTSIIESASTAECTLAGYTTQAAFLLHCDLLELAQKTEINDPISRYQQTQAIKTLTLPSQMGEAIKVMALAKNYVQPLRGFTFQDRQRDL